MRNKLLIALFVATTFAPLPALSEKPSWLSDEEWRSLRKSIDLEVRERVERLHNADLIKNAQAVQPKVPGFYWLTYKSKSEYLQHQRVDVVRVWHVESEMEWRYAITGRSYLTWVELLSYYGDVRLTFEPITGKPSSLSDKEWKSHNPAATQKN